MYLSRDARERYGAMQQAISDVLGRATGAAPGSTPTDEPLSDVDYDLRPGPLQRAARRAHRRPAVATRCRPRRMAPALGSGAVVAHRQAVHGMGHRARQRLAPQTGHEVACRLTAMRSRVIAAAWRR